MNSKLFRFAASSLVLGVTMVGCKPSAEQLYRPVSASAKAAKADQQAFKHYGAAQERLAKGDIAEALAAMENAVAFSPRDAGYRMGLAELYMKSGRFRSAETTLRDVLELNPSDGRAGISLALAQLAQGRGGAAVAQLNSLEGQVGASDLGLAYALAGETGRALELLEAAARAPEANGRVRQNLALAYALAGDWKKARITASQDVSPAQLNNRLAQWAALADPAAAPMRIANILGVKPVEDTGQPSRLALAPAAPEPVAFAEAPRPSELAASTAVAAVEDRPLRVAFAQAEPIQAQIPTAEAPVVTDFVPIDAPDEQSDVVVTQSVYAEAAGSLVQPAVASTSDAPEARMESIRAYVAARNDTPKLEPRARKASRGNYVVQLGAYSSPANVETAWARAVKRYGAILAHEPLSTTINFASKKTLYRLSMAGFDSQSEAARTCRSIRAKGGACFVRTIAGDAPVQWASRYARNG